MEFVIHIGYYRGVRHIPELDGLRAVAVVAVVLFHAAPNGLFRGGFVGVDIFFVLSAFLITGILAKGQSLRRFYWHRFIRLMPALLLMLGAYLLAGSIIWPGYAHGRDAALAALYLSDYSYSFWRVPWYLQHTWSLSVEEHFYLLWPFIVPVLMRSKQPTMWLAAAYVALTAWRLPFIGDFHDYYYRFDTHATGLIAGAWLYFARPKISGLSASFAALTFAFFLFVSDIRQAWLSIMVAEACAVAVIAYAAEHGSTLLRSAPFVALGRISYGVYLWHFPIALAVRGQSPFIERVGVSLGLSVVLATLSNRTVERWAKRLRKLPDDDLAVRPVAACLRGARSRSAGS